MLRLEEMNIAHQKLGILFLYVMGRIMHKF